MYKYNMIQHTLLMGTSVLIPTNNISRHVNIVKQLILNSIIDILEYKKVTAQRTENN